MDVDALIEQKKCLAIMGPTASGKSRLSMAIAEVLPIEIISVDSALIYRGMDIGTAKPTFQEMQMVPHHLIDILEPSESYSAADFVDDVHQLVEAIHARGRLPALVGGTMMYFNALQKGMATLPAANEEIRERIQQLWSEDAIAAHQRLADIDPKAAARIHPNDPQRLIRALEVYEMTGTPLSELQAAQQGNGLTAFELMKVALLVEDRALLHAQIEKRFLEMLDQNFIQEVKNLKLNPALHQDLPAIRSVGYRQAWQYLNGELDYDTFIHKGVVATRQLAKRQITWLRKEENLLEMDPFKVSLSDQVNQVCEYIKKSR